MVVGAGWLGWEMEFVVAGLVVVRVDGDGIGEVLRAEAVVMGGDGGGGC